MYGNAVVMSSNANGNAQREGNRPARLFAQVRLTAMLGGGLVDGNFIVTAWMRFAGNTSEAGQPGFGRPYGGPLRQDNNQPSLRGYSASISSNSVNSCSSGLGAGRGA